MKFESKKEILWGSDDEIKSYLPELFELLWDELTEDDLVICDESEALGLAGIRGGKKDSILPGD